MKCILLIFLALTLLLLPACAELPDADTDSKEKIHTSQVVSRKLAEYGDYIYLVEDRLLRYNRKTGELRPFCTDPKCNHSCVFCAMPIEVTQVTNGRLYFNGLMVRTFENIHAYIDLVTEEATVLLRFPLKERTELSRPVLDNGWLYYTAQRLRKGGEAANPDDYEPYVGRIPMDGGDSEFVCLIEDSVGEWIYAVVDGNVITLYQNIFYINTPENGERKVLFDPEDHEFFRFIDKINYLDGYIYCLVHTDEHFKSEYYPDRLGKCYLVKINARTGEMKQLVNEPVYGLTITDDTIYYTEQTIRTIYAPEDYEKHPENVVVTGSYETIYACDLDGNNRREIYTNPNLDVNYFNRIIDNCLYGWIYEYDETAHKMSERFFGKVDFSTGEVTAATRVK